MLRFDESGVPNISNSLPMALFGAGLAMSIVFRPVGIWSYVSAALGGVDEMGDALPPDWRFMLGVISVLDLAWYPLMVISAIAYFRRRRSARQLVIWTLLSSLAIVAVEAAWTTWLARGDAQYIAETLSPAIFSALVAIVWLIYFSVSKRVRETLVYPLEALDRADTPIVPRFSLRLILILCTAIAILLGYNQYRRKWILTACAELQKEKYAFHVPNAWHDRIWQRKPTVGVVVKDNDGRWRMQVARRSSGGLYYTYAEPEGSKRLKSLGMVAYEEE